jgi:hypothetical protein
VSVCLKVYQYVRSCGTKDIGADYHPNCIFREFYVTSCCPFLFIVEIPRQFSASDRRSARPSFVGVKWLLSAASFSMRSLTLAENQGSDNSDSPQHSRHDSLLSPLDIDRKYEKDSSRGAKDTSQNICSKGDSLPSSKSLVNSSEA